MIETSQFQTLVAVAKFKSFSKAADELGVTQSAISQSIKNLERKVKAKLFIRLGKNVVLTVEGEKLHSLAFDFLSKVEKILDEIKFDQKTMSGKIRIGTLTGIGKSWLAPQLLKFGKEFENIILSLNLGLYEDLIREFQENKLDLLVLPEASLPHIGEKILIGEEKSTLVFSKANEFAIDENITFDKLSSLPTVLFEQNDSSYFRWCQRCFGRTPTEVNMRYSVNSHGNMLQAVLQGFGVAVMPLHVLNRSVYRNKVLTLGHKFEISNGKFYLVYHKDSRSLLRIDTILKRLSGCSNPFFAGG